MRRVCLDKIASAAKNADLDREAYVTDDVVAEEGYVVAVRVLTDKAVYNQLENEHGRMTRLKPGDEIAGVLGRRRALRGYAGDVPEEIRVGDQLNVLNLGGVIGRCTSYAPEVGAPFQVEVLGAVLHFPYLGERVGVPAHIGQGAIPDAGPLDSGAPIVAVVGTAMDAGKTVAACEIIHGLGRRGKAVAAAKVTGVALQRDVLRMADHGAAETLSFVDAGVVSTAPTTAVQSTRRIISQLSAGSPDAIVLEMGDGMLGEYGVQEILAAPDIAGRIAAVVLCATDPVSAWGGVRLLAETYGLGVDVISGPATDNDVGQGDGPGGLGLPAANALTAPDALAGHVHGKVFGHD